MPAGDTRRPAPGTSSPATVTTPDELQQLLADDPSAAVAMFQAWRQVEGEAAAILRDALAEQRELAPDPDAIAAAAATFRERLRSGDPHAAWMSRAAGLPDALTWGRVGPPMGDEDHLLECLSATVSWQEDPGLPAAQRDRILELEIADWLGAIIGLVRAGPGTDADPAALLTHIEACPEIEPDTLDEETRLAIVRAFEVVVPAWQAAGVVDADQRLTAVGAWLLPRAAAIAWGHDFDGDGAPADHVDLDPLDDIDPFDDGVHDDDPFSDDSDDPVGQGAGTQEGIGAVEDLAPRVLLPDDHLAARVTATPIWRQLMGFLTYVGERLPLTDAGNLKLADARRLVDELGTGDTFDPQRLGHQARTRSSTELPRLVQLFDAAVALGLVEPRGRTLHPVAERIAELRDDPVSGWVDLVDAILSAGLLGAPGFFEPWWVRQLNGDVMAVLLGLDDADEAGGCVPAERLAEVLPDMPTLRGRIQDPALRPWVTHDVHRFFERLDALGLVELSSLQRTPHPFGEELSGGQVAPTPLTALCLHRLVGLPAHRVGELADRPAGEFLDLVATLPVQVAAGEVAAWLAQQGRWPLDDVGDDGLEAMIGVLATLADLDGPAAVSEALQQLGDAREQIGFIGVAWRATSPGTLTVLNAIGDTHPDKAVRKAGRKAAFKRRSSG